MKKKLMLVELVCSRCGIVGKALPSAVLLYCSKCGNGKGKRVAWHSSANGSKVALDQKISDFM